MRWFAGVALVAALAACSPSSESRPPMPTAGTPALPEGWRWESYHDVEVGVPGDWGYTEAGRITDWCSAGARLTSGFGRPAATDDILCWDGTGAVDPGSLIAKAGSYVAVVPTSQGTLADEGDRIVLIPNGLTQVVIQAPPALRAQIAATVHRITDVDHNGCAVHHPIAEDPAWRPAPVDVTTLTGVDALRACRYTALEPAADAGPAVSLYSSLRLEGAAARAALAGLAGAPRGSGPNDPGSCTDGYGEERIVVQALRADRRVAEIVVRYSGCDHHGFDDGVTVRRLTAEAITPFVTEPNLPFAFSGEMAGVLRPALEAAQNATAGPTP